MPLTGVGFSFLAAVFTSARRVTVKVAATGADEFLTGFATRITAAGIFAILIITWQEFYIPEANVFWVAFVCNSILLGLATVLIAKALKISDISIVAPILALLPVAVAIPAFLSSGK